MKVLVLGSSGTVGRSLITNLMSAGCAVVSVGRRPESQSSQHFQIRSPKQINMEMIDQEVAHIFFAYGVSSIRRCEKNPRYTYNINVSSVKQILNLVIPRQIPFTFFSSAEVFDGSRPMRSDGDSLCPNSMYGFQKSVVENYIRQEATAYNIVRTGKLLGDIEAVMSWERELSKNGTIRVDESRHVSPLFVHDVTLCLAYKFNENLGTVSQVSAHDDLSYRELFELYVNTRGLGDSMKSCSLEFRETQTHFESLEPSGLFEGSVKYGSRDVSTRYIRQAFL